MQPDLSAIFALRLSTASKLVLIAMVHRARDGWYRGHVTQLASDAQIHRVTAEYQIWDFQEMGLIHPHPGNKARLQTRAWRVDPKLTIERGMAA